MSERLWNLRYRLLLLRVNLLQFLLSELLREVENGG